LAQKLHSSVKRFCKYSTFSNSCKQDSKVRLPTKTEALYASLTMPRSPSPQVSLSERVSGSILRQTRVDLAGARASVPLFYPSPPRASRSDRTAPLPQSLASRRRSRLRRSVRTQIAEARRRRGEGVREGGSPRGGGGRRSPPSRWVVLPASPSCCREFPPARPRGSDPLDRLAGDRVLFLSAIRHDLASTAR
jgi:hypothetical protein